MRMPLKDYARRSVEPGVLSGAPRPVPVLLRLMQEAQHQALVRPSFTFKNNVRIFKDQSTSTSMFPDGCCLDSDDNTSSAIIGTNIVRKTLYSEMGKKVSRSPSKSLSGVDSFVMQLKAVRQQGCASQAKRRPKLRQWHHEEGDCGGCSPSLQTLTGLRRQRMPTNSIPRGNDIYPKDYIPCTHAPSSKFHEGCRFFETRQSRKGVPTLRRRKINGSRPIINSCPFQDCSYTRCWRDPWIRKQDPWIQKQDSWIQKQNSWIQKQVPMYKEPPPLLVRSSLRRPRLPKRVVMSRIIDSDRFSY